MSRTDESPAPFDLETELAKVSADVQRLQRDLNAIKKNPNTWELMRYYLKGKGHHLVTVDYVLAGVEDFLAKFLLPKKKK